MAPTFLRIAVFALLAGVFPPAVAVIDPAPSQDDAGTGADAPDAFADALRLPPGTYQGEIFTFSPSGVPDPALDQQDWYAFWIPENASVLVASQLVGGRPPVLELHRPDGRFASYHLVGAAAYQPGGLVPPLVTDVGGWWAVRVRGEEAATYRFTISWANVTGPSFAAPGPGHATVGFEVGANATVSLTLATSFGKGYEEARRDYYVFTPSGARFVLHGVNGIGVTPVGIRLGDLRVEAHPATHDAGSFMELFVTSEGGGPERIYFTILVDAPESYTYLANVATSGNATFLGGSAGPAWALRSSDLRSSDIQGAAAVSTEVASASAFGMAILGVQGALVGSFDCGVDEVGSCTLRRPDGSTTSRPLEIVAGGSPGSWTFTREHGAGTWDDLVVFAADVRLPG